MTDGFRLLSAETAASIDRPRWRPEHYTGIVRPIKVSFDFQNSDFSSEGLFNGHISVLLGRNGQGKSRLLSAIASSFQLIQNYSRARPLYIFPLRHLAYVNGGRLYEITSSSGQSPKLMINGREAELSSAMLPAKVIALSMTAFDKFPIGSESASSDSSELEPRDVYSYIGMRERMGQSSVSALLFRAVEVLLMRHAQENRGRIAREFETVGYRPNLDIVFRVESTLALREFVNHGEQALIDRSRPYGPPIINRIERLLNSGEKTKHYFREAGRAALEMMDRGFVVIPFDVYEPSPKATLAFRRLQFLRQFQFARFFGVGAQKANGDLVDFQQASSGELSIAITFMSLAAHLQDNSLVLIDEPETSLHPEWQSKYIDLMTSTFSAYRNCHYVLATHSPLILSDAPPTATLSSVSDKVPSGGSDVSGRPVDYLLVKAFQVASGSNYYVQEELVKALRLAADGKANDVEFQTTVRQLANIKPLIKDNAGVVALISGLEKIAERGSVISDR